jgi:hypothetical protein
MKQGKAFFRTGSTPPPAAKPLPAKESRKIKREEMEVSVIEIDT